MPEVSGVKAKDQFIIFENLLGRAARRRSEAQVKQRVYHI